MTNTKFYTLVKLFMTCIFFILTPPLLHLYAAVYTYEYTIHIPPARSILCTRIISAKEQTQDSSFAVQTTPSISFCVFDTHISYTCIYVYQGWPTGVSPTLFVCYTYLSVQTVLCNILYHANFFFDYIITRQLSFDILYIFSIAYTSYITKLL